jgi:peptide deformylase
MALRLILTDEDILRKKSKEVKTFGGRTHTLLDDMWETMREADGIGLAATQVGVLRRAIVIDITMPLEVEEGEMEESGAYEADASEAEAMAADSSEADTALEAKAEQSSSDEAETAEEAEVAPVNFTDGALFELLNPVIISAEGEQCDKEGCLSVPGVYGMVKRPARMKVSAVDRDGRELLIEAEGILAKALSHEIDHLEGVLFTDTAEEIEDFNRMAEQSGQDGEQDEQ